MSLGERVTLLCRSRTRGEKAVGSLCKDHPLAPRPHLLVADITSLEQIDRAGSELNMMVRARRLPAITCLVHNAGLVPKELRSLRQVMR